MQIVRKSNILIKTERKLVVHQFGSEAQIRCEQCGEQMITAQAAAVLLGIGIRDIYRLIENGKFHFVETENKIGFLCLKTPDINLTTLEAVNSLNFS